MLSWENVVFIVVTIILGSACFYLWRRGGQSGAVGSATLDLIAALSREVEELKTKVHLLEVGTANLQGRVAFLQSELALANAEVSALEALIKEQAGRIADLTIENERLRRSMTQVMKKTGTLDWSEP